jgi:hypothetical protein
VLDEFGLSLESAARWAQSAGRALPDGDDESRREEDRYLPEFDRLALVDVVCGAQDGEQDVPLVVLLDLGTQVKRLCVLDCEIVQAKALLHGRQLIGVGLE